MKQRLSQAALICLLLATSSPLFAQDLFFFGAPSKNIHCVYDRNSANGRPYIRCDIGQFTPSLKLVPQQTQEEIEIVGRCTPARMRAFVIEQDATAPSTFCPTDAPISEEQRVLGYGSKWQNGGFTCLSETSGMTCQNNLGHGFMLSRAFQKVF